MQLSFEQATQLWRAGRRREAETACRELLAVNPNDANAMHLLAILMQHAGQAQLAIDLVEKALAIQPASPEFHNTHAGILMRLSRFEEAERAMRQTLQLNPNFQDARYNLGLIFQKQNRSEEAVIELRKSIEIQPNRAEVWNNLSVALRNSGNLDDALAAVDRAIAINAALPSAQNNRAGLLKDLGRVPESVEAFRQLVLIEPKNAQAHSNLLYALHFDSRSTPQSLYAEHRRWNEQHAAKLQSQISAHPNDRSPDRRLKIGFVSPDFRAHPIARLLRPYFENRNRAAVELFCYSDVPRHDELTASFKSSADGWRDCAGISDAQLADLIRDDEIDILVDLTMHMANNRMLLFARKPAPVQVTYLAYCSTTGLDAMDYRLTDRFLDACESREKIYSEKSIALESYWCYAPPRDAPPIAPRDQQSITFGCLNEYCKISDEALATWKRLLERVSNSRLLIFAREGLPRQRVLAAGFDPARISFVDRQPLRLYLATYDTIDVALDPFPYAGGTTSCDALWMGVPFVTLAGQTAVSRSGVSLLSQVGLTDLIAQSVDQYISIAGSLANDLDRLQEIRQTLRDRMTQSPLMDATKFSRNLDAAFRAMWRSASKS